MLNTVSAKTIQKYLAEAIVLGFVAGLATPCALRASVLWSTEASERARQFEITCGTCPNPVTELSNLSDGGFGQQLAKVDFSFGGLATADALAIFTGPNSLPHLAALVSADINVVSPSTFFYQTTAVARATQMYTYTGTAPATYTIDYNVNGNIAGGILTEIAGGFTVFGNGFQPGQEVEPTLGFTFDHVNGDGDINGHVSPVHLTGDVTFTVNPGDNFFVQSTIDVFADSRSQQLAALADAFHTLDMSFTQGDTSLLIAAGPATASGVPEPTTALLTGLGLAAVVIATRRRRVSR